MPETIRVEGLRETVKQLEALGADRNAITEAGYSSAEILIRAALPLVPVRSGRLKSTLRPGRIKAGAVARAGTGSVPYAPPIHWGWAIVGANHKGKLTPTSRRRFRNVPPQPFFAEALGYTKEEIVANYDKLMQEAVNKHLGKDK